MHDELAWIRGRVRLGWAVLAGGAAVLIVATVVSVADLVPGWDFRIVGALGILGLGLGLGLVIRYRPALRDTAAARRVIVEERDERTVQIRTRAGNRAWIVSAVFVWVGLMWVSLAGSGGVPALDGDVLWWFLAAALVVPFLVYTGSLTLDERHS
jgi:hypothetical protein